MAIIEARGEKNETINPLLLTKINLDKTRQSQTNKQKNIPENRNAGTKKSLAEIVDKQGPSGNVGSCSLIIKSCILNDCLGKGVLLKEKV